MGIYYDEVSGRQDHTNGCYTNNDDMIPNVGTAKAVMAVRTRARKTSLEFFLALKIEVWMVLVSMLLVLWLFTFLRPLMRKNGTVLIPVWHFFLVFFNQSIGKPPIHSAER